MALRCEVSVTASDFELSDPTAGMGSPVGCPSVLAMLAFLV